MNDPVCRVAVFFNWTMKPAPLTLLLKAPFVTVKLVIVAVEPAVESKSTLSPNDPVTEVLLNVTVPLASVMCTPLSAAAVPLLVTEQPLSERLANGRPADAIVRAGGRRSCSSG